MVSDSELLDRLQKILGSSDLDIATAGSVRRQLEEEFGISLHDRKAFIREQIDIFLQTRVPKPQNHDAEQHQEVEEDGNNEEIKEQSVDGGNGSLSEMDTKEEEEEEESEENGEAKSKSVKRSHMMDSNEKKRGSGFSKPCAISPQLQEVVGMPEMGRTEVVKKMWAYIRKKDLQNPEDKRMIICDETLRRIFRVNTINMFQMNKALSKHIWPIDAEDEAPVRSSSQKEGKHKKSRQEVLDEPTRKGKQKQGRASGFLASVPLSEAVALDRRDRRRITITSEEKLLK